MMVDARLDTCVFLMNKAICILEYVRYVNSLHMLKILGFPVFTLVSLYHTACSGELLPPAVRDAMPITPSISYMTAPHAASPSTRQLRQRCVLVVVSSAPSYFPKSYKAMRNVWLDQCSSTSRNQEPNSHGPKVHMSLFPRKKK